MNEQMTESVLQVIPLAARLSSSELEALGKEYPEFDIPSLLTQASTMGAPAMGAPAMGAAAVPSAAVNPALQLKTLKFELEVTRRALGRLVPECDQAWRENGAKLTRAARTEFIAGVVGAVGGGGAAVGVFAQLHAPTVVSGIVGCLASVLTLRTQYQRGALTEGGLAAQYAVFARARGQLRQLQEEVTAWLPQPRDLLLANHDRILATARRAQELGAEVDAALGRVGPGEPSE